MMVGLALKAAGHTVRAASDGPEGIQRFDEEAPWDLVLLDQRMPEMDGLEVLHELRARIPSTRVIMITAFGTIDLAVEAMKSGATDFLRKPFSADTLRGAVEAALKGVKTNDTNVSSTAITFGLTTINGFRIESKPNIVNHAGGEYTFQFMVTNPLGAKQDCTVILPIYVIELVKAHANSEHLPGDNRFWQALCEEVLANHVWQHAEFPSDNVLRIDDLNTGLRRWIDTVVTA